MVLVSPLSPSDNAIIRRIRHVFTVLSLVFALLTIFIILSCKDRQSTKYSRLILAIVYISLLSELYLQLVYDPIFFLPVPCFARDDPWLHIPGRAAIHHCIWASLAVLNAPVFLACFIHRHQAVMAIGSRWSFSSKVQNAPSLFFVILVFVFPLIIYRSMQPPGVFTQYVEMMSPDWPSSLLDRSDCFYPDRMLTFSIIATIVLLVGSAFVVVIISHTFATLREKSVLSERMKAYHQTMTRVLIVQSGIPAIFALFPTSVCFSVFFFDWDGIVILPACYVSFSAYSFFHSVAVITTTPVYRKQFMLMIKTHKTAMPLSREASSVTPRLNSMTRYGNTAFRC